MRHKLDKTILIDTWKLFKAIHVPKNLPSTKTTSKSSSSSKPNDHQHHFSQNQSLALMESMNEILCHHHKTKASKSLLHPTTYHNNQHQYSLSLHNLRSELTALQTTETSQLQAKQQNLHQSLDLMRLKLLNDLQKLQQSDIQLEINQRKSEVREATQTSEMKIREVEQRIGLLGGRLRSELEALKVELLSKWASGIVLGTAISLGFVLKSF